MLEKQKITILGLGYVGLPLAFLCAQKNLDVTGVDISSEKIELLKRGISPIKDEEIESSLNEAKDKILFTDSVSEAIKNSSIVVVCVPTPVDGEHVPNLEPLKKACESIAESIREDTLVVIESTIFPGTIEEIVEPIINKSNTRFYLAHCPERIDPGNKKFTISNIPRVVGGIDEKSTTQAAEFYRKIIDARVMELSSVKAAEATKIMENTFRDVNIAFINEMAMSFDKAGINILEVIKGASTKPFAFMPHYPGAGVGGHCIPVDPYYLIERARQIGFNHKFLSLARKINEEMPNYVIEILNEEMNKSGANLKDAKVGVMGLAYKANIDDTRESPSYKIIANLKTFTKNIFVFDPYVKDKSNVKNVEELLENSDFVIIATDHREFKDLDLNKFKEKGIKIIIDGKNCLDKEKIKELGIIYRGIGRR